MSTYVNDLISPSVSAGFNKLIFSLRLINLDKPVGLPYNSMMRLLISGLQRRLIIVSTLLEGVNCRLVQTLKPGTCYIQS